MGIRGISALALLASVFLGGLASGEHEGLLPAAAELYPRRYELPVLERLIGIYEGALADRGDAPGILSRLAQFWYERAMLVDEKRACFEEARDYALAALRAGPGFAELEREGGLVEAIGASADKAALLWYAAAQGQLLGMMNPLAAMRLMRPVRAAYERVAELEETFWGCSAIHALGAFEANIASNPLARLFLGGSWERAREYFERAVSLCPGYLQNYVVYARDYAVPRRDAELFRALLSRVIEGPIDPWPFWNRVSKRDAEALIREHPELWGE